MILLPMLAFGPMAMAAVCYIVGRRSKETRNLLVALTGAAAFVCCGFAAGASATGAARWYMAAAMGLGALCWRWCVSHAVHRALRGTVFVLVWPLRFAADYAVHPFKQRLLARIRKIRHARRHNAQDSCKKSGKKPKNVLQNKHTILYN